MARVKIGAFNYKNTGILGVKTNVAFDVDSVGVAHVLYSHGIRERE